MWCKEDRAQVHALTGDPSAEWSLRSWMFSPHELAYTSSEDRPHDAEIEPNETTTALHDSLHDNLKEPEHHHFGPAETVREVDESKLCLLDTACTACMHSRRWREAYSKSLPEGYECTPTPQRKTFHFANGSSTANQAVVWRIPIFIAGRRGEVYSAEIPDGMTPLLFSIPAMDSLDMVIHVRKLKVSINELKIELPLIVTPSRHLAVEVAFDPKVGVLDHNPEEPKVISEREDLLVYYGEEARYPLLHNLPLLKEPLKVARSSIRPDLQPRGVRASDQTGDLPERRLHELQAAAFNVSAQDRRTWIALKREYSMAEQFCTRDFNTTVIYEPFAGSFGTTTMGAAQYGLTNSQPMDKIDGYDLLTREGRALVWNVLVEHEPFLVLIAFDCRIWSLLTNLSPDAGWEEIRESLGRDTLHFIVKVCKFQDSRGRYYLLENPAGSLAWIFDGILARLLSSAHGKFAIGDQCAYGKVDKDSGRPVKKATGWLSNSEVLLNYVGKRCQCLWGSHEVIIGRNSFGSRSAQAAAYPKELCRSICKGVLRQMEIDYQVYMSSQQFAFALVPRDELEEWDFDIDVDPLAVGEWGDLWQIDGHRLFRHHNIQRRKLFVPCPSMNFPDPVKFEHIEDGRVTKIKFEDGNTKLHQSKWQKEPVGSMSHPWTCQALVNFGGGPLSQ